MSTIQIKTPRWALPLLAPKRYKGAYGGRGSGKSHFFAELLVEEHIADPDQQSVCVREIQKSLQFSAKKLIESKIYSLGVSHMFEILQNEIRRKDGRGLIIFQGLQDHTADSIKSLEGFNRAWVEEAQSISRRSMELLLPTIRAPGSEIWFSWNPENPDDPVENLFKTESSDAISVRANYIDNPFLPDTLKQEAERHRRTDPDTFEHVWLGGYNTRSESQVFKGKYVIREFSPDHTYNEPLFGCDFGFSVDPTALVQLYVKENTLFIYKEAGKVGLELDDMAAYVFERLPDLKRYPLACDSARPESISYIKRHGITGAYSVSKGKGSVEDGVEFIKSFDMIVIHPDCEHVAQEFRLYSYKEDPRTGAILPKLEDKHNHYIDAIRYALEKMMKKSRYDYSSLI